MEYGYFKKEIESICKDNPFEHELYSIVAQIIRETNIDDNLYLRDVSKDRRGQKNKKFWECYFGAGSGFPDFVVLNNNKTNLSKRIKGCIELKYIDKKINVERNSQIEGYIKYFKKVIYSNGLLWKYYDKAWEDMGNLGEYDSNKNIIKWNSKNEWNILIKNLKSIKW